MNTMIAGIGFAQMAWKEAQRRKGKAKWLPDEGPHPRIESYFMSPAENEYYRMCDAANIGHMFVAVGGTVYL